TLFEWLVELYPVWARLDAEAEYAAARTGLAELARSGCSTVFDHHYVVPRGSMDLGASHGGLPPDSLVETLDEILTDTERVAGLADGDLLQIAVAPCSPFSVTRQLMVESAALARRLGLRLHTHLAETADEDEFCRERYGCTPVEYLIDVGWLGDDVWCAHCVHV